MNDQQIFEQTRGHWKIAASVRDRTKYCLGVAYGIVRGVYRVEPDSWFPSEMPMDHGKGLWGFNGSRATELQHVVGTHVRDVFGGRAIYRRYLNGYPGSPDLADATSVR